MIGNDWDLALKEEFEKDYFLKIKDFINKEYETKTIYPPYDDIFNAFKLTPLNEVKVVILGQDPYHERDKPMDLHFQHQLAVQNQDHSTTSLKKSMQNMIIPFQNQDVWNLGQTRVYFYSIQF